MIYNTRNRSNDATESQKEKKNCFNAHFQYSQSKITRLNKMRSFKSFAMLKWESRTSPRAAAIMLCSDALFLLFQEWLAYSHRQNIWEKL